MAELTSPKKNDTLETNVAVSPTYGEAISEKEKKGKALVKMYKKMEDEANDVVVPTPKVKKVEEKLSLSESLFDDEPICEKKGEVEELADDAWTLVYDSIFSGNRFKRPQIVDSPITFEANRYWNKEPAGDTDIGVVVENEDEEDYIYDVADKLEIKIDRPKIKVEDGGRLLILRLGENEAKMSAKDFLETRGIDIETVRGKKKKTNECKLFPNPINEAEEEMRLFYAEFVDNDGKKHWANIHALNRGDAERIVVNNGYKPTLVSEINLKKTEKYAEEKVNECKIIPSTNHELTEDLKVFMELGDYEPWSGAVSTWDKIRDEDKIDELDAILEDQYPEGIGLTELNDLLWFDGDTVLSWLGIGEEEEDDE